MKHEDRLVRIGHRGAAGHEPENTLRSMRKAIELGADWIEFDVYSVENELVVFHDDRLERTTNGRGYITEHPLGYLRSLDAGKGERIPFLREALNLIDGRAGVNIELKGAETALPVVRLLREYLDNGRFRLDQLLLSSFNHPELMKARQIDAAIWIAPVIACIPICYARFAQAMGAYSIHLSREFISRELLEDAHLRGLKVFVYTVNDPEELTRMEKIGVDGVFTDFPELGKAISRNDGSTCRSRV